MAEELPLLYPFVQDGKWGYIDTSGKWVIEPQFDRCLFVFNSTRTWAQRCGLWGMIDRTGRWVLKPRFTGPSVEFAEQRLSVVTAGERKGLLAKSGELILPAQYDEIVCARDRAWVRLGEKLGLVGADGEWVQEPVIAWPPDREMPIPTEDGVSWFRRGQRWGLLSSEGRVLFAPRFAAHVMGRRESEEWDHPEGLDFERGRAWVMEKGDYVLITAAGEILARHPFSSIVRWNDDLYVFSTPENTEGLVSRDGRVVLAAQYHEIRPLAENRAVIVQRKERIKADGNRDDFFIFGYIDQAGRVIVEPGKYRCTLEDFSEGLAPAESHPPGDRWDPYAGYIDREGRVAIPFQYLKTVPFSEGLGAFLEAKRRPGLSPDKGLWGYLNALGEVVIPPRFGWASPFFRGRAWVLEAGAYPDQPRWAMIDRSGKILTPFAYFPPEKYFNWDNRGIECLNTCRVRGDFFILKKGDFLTGLAAPDGRILIEATLNHIRDFHDGVAVAIDSRQYPKFITLLVTERGEMLACDKYTEITDYDRGVAWATHRWTDHRGPFKDDGWHLIDVAAREMTSVAYMRAHWIFVDDLSYRENPVFCGELAAVATVQEYTRYGESVWERNSWGYVNRSGRVVAWHPRNGVPVPNMPGP